MNDALVGRTLAGKYVIKRVLGAGGMGAVYEAEHAEIGKRVAVKVIAAHAAQNAEMAERFKREARAASAVESESIVQVFDVGRDPDAGLYMVMEFLTGEDLQSHLAKLGGPLPIADAMTIGVQLARALAKAHAAGVVHRDLKPANVFLTPREDGSTLVKILDFGISKLARDETQLTGKRGLTREGTVIGTPQYMSPEQAQGLPVDPRTDVWSLGAVLYEALAGRSAYEEKPSYEATIIQIATTAPRPLAEVAPWVPPELAAIVHGALVHDANARIPDCATFAARLQSLGGLSARAGGPASGGALPPASGPESGRIVVRPPSTREVVPAAATAEGVVVPRTGAARGRGGVLAGLAVLAVAVLGVGIFFATRGARPDPAARAPEHASAVSAAASPAPPAVDAGALAATTAAPPIVPTVPVVPTVGAAPSAPAAPAGTARAQNPGRATPRPTGAAGARTAAPNGTPASQYGAAGIATAY